MQNRWLRILHWIIIFNFALGILYGAYMVMFVIGGGGGWPLFNRATATPVEVILKRRLYSVETWIATSGLAVYLALTEFLPRYVKRWIKDYKAGVFDGADKEQGSDVIPPDTSRGFKTR
ncbi:MAG: hypothetical protein ACLFWD_02255 [Anaerolineales bacterium]